MIESGYSIAGRYRIIRQIGEGEVSVVYLAHDLILDRDVAVKVLRYQLTKNSLLSQQFEESAASIAELSSPNIVNIYDIGNDRNNPYLVMENVEGNNLKDYLALHFPIDLVQVKAIMEQILSAVAKAHSLGFVHGDLVPGNILVGMTGLTKVADFGLLNALKQVDIQPLNADGFYYLAPEQLSGNAPSKQSDLYSLGIILYEMICGSLPFDQEKSVTVALSELTHLQQQNPRIPQSLVNMIIKATAFYPRDRYQSAEQMLQDLETALDPERFNEPLLNLDDSAQSNHAVAQVDDSGNLLGPVGEKISSSKTNNPWSRQKKVLVIASSLLAFLLILIVLLILLNRKKDVTVPDVANLTQEAAVSQLTAKKIKVSPKVERVSSETVASGKVVKTDPPANSTVKEGSAVRLFVSSGAPRVKVGNYVSQPFVEAKSLLERSGLEVESKRQYSDIVKEGLVISQSENPNTEVAKGSRIILTVSKGVETFTMSNLIGLTAGAVSEFANQTGLNPVENPAQYSDEYPVGTVMAQNPNFGTKLKKGENFQITYSKGAKPRESLPANNPGTPLADLTGMKRNEINSYVKSLHLKVIEDPAQYSDEFSPGVVMVQSPAPGTVIRANESIRVTYSLGPKPSPSNSQESDSNSSSQSSSSYKEEAE